MVLTVSLIGMIARTIETMGADRLLWHTDTVDKSLYLGELEGGKLQSTSNLSYKTVIFMSASSGICLKILIGIALEIIDDLACDKFHIAL